MGTWKDVTLSGGIRLSVPPELAEDSDQGMDSDVATWTGPGISIMVDRGPFVDSLESAARRPGNRSNTETIDGRSARIVSFDDEGALVVAAHLPGSRSVTPPVENVTVVVRVDPAEVEEEVAYRVIRSIKLPGS